MQFYDCIIVGNGSIGMASKWSVREASPLLKFQFLVKDRTGSASLAAAPW